MSEVHENASAHGQLAKISLNVTHCDISRQTDMVGVHLGFAQAKLNKTTCT